MLILIDEDLPRSLAEVLRLLNFEVEDVRDIGLRGKSDEAIFNYAQTIEAVIITGDLGFCDPNRFNLKAHAGIIILRIPNEVSVQTTKDIVYKLLSQIEHTDIAGRIIIIEPDRLRIKLKSKPLLFPEN